jgi:hypothetical protein
MKGPTPLFSYYGSKYRGGPRYPAPRYPVIVEPFAGSAGYALRHWRRRVILCDTDPIVVGVWRYLLATPSEEILALPDLEDGQTTDDLALPPEARWFIGFWINKGAASPRKQMSAWGRSGVAPTSRWGQAVRRRVAIGVSRVRHWRVFERPYYEAPISGQATWFVDPPYQVQGMHYRHGSDGVDFDHLGQWCRRRPGQVIVCEQMGASWLPFRHINDAKTARNERSSEAIWTSHPPRQMSLELKEP